MNHTIVSTVEARPARVQCNTCHGVHNYRKEKAARPAAKAAAKAPASKAAPRQPRKAPGEAARQEWADLMAVQDGARPTPYDMQAVYQLGSLVKHPTFGLGIVRQRPGAHKVEILFEGGLKLLRCG